jgi:hypothetical protein
LDAGGDTEFEDIFDASDSKAIKLSQVLENSLFLDLQKECMQCMATLREEEILSGMQKHISEYTIKCPVCEF